MKTPQKTQNYDDFDNPYVRLAYMCRICGKEQSKKFKFDWKRHYLTHNTTPKDFICEICGKGFNQKGPLNKHMRSKHQQTDVKTEDAKLMFVKQEGPY